MLTVVFMALMFLSMMIALVDWRRGWLMAILCGVLQDPARKLTPGTPVVMTFSIVAVYAIVIFAAQGSLQNYARDFAKRFSSLYGAVLLALLFLGLAAANGIATFGINLWKVPALSLFIYCLPLPAVILGYAYVRREQDIYGLFRFYAIVTAIALIGSPLEYLHVKSQALGTVALNGVNLRFLPGMQIRMLSGFYRAPDIMGWHAATLASIGVIMAMQRRALARAWPWMLVAGWGFYNCIISGRRKAVYMVAVFAVAFVWRYMRRLAISEIVTFALVACVLGGVVHEVMQAEESSMYARGAATTRTEIFGRLEGGVIATVEQYGFMGAGLGTATQGTQHLSGGVGFGWQEGGLGKLAIELGVPGLMALSILVFVLLRLMLAISAHPDVPASHQLLRAGLFGMVAADVATFMASAQAYSDPLLALFSAFTVGALFATAVLDEREQQTSISQPRLIQPERGLRPGVAAAT